MPIGVTSGPRWVPLQRNSATTPSAVSVPRTHSIAMSGKAVAKVVMKARNSLRPLNTCPAGTKSTTQSSVARAMTSSRRPSLKSVWMR